MVAPAPQPALSEHDVRLVAALTNPTPENDAVLAALPDLAGWLERPEVQRALAAAETARGLRLRARAARRAEHAMERLAAVLDAASDLSKPEHLAETRRAASTLFRVCAHVLAPRPALAPQKIPPRPATPTFPAQPEEPPLLDTTTPAATVAGVVAALRRLPSEAPRAALSLIAKAVDSRVQHHPLLRERFLAGLAASPVLSARARPSRAEPVAAEGDAAVQRVVYTLPDGAHAAALFRTVRARDTGSIPSWVLDAVIPADSS